MVEYTTISIPKDLKEDVSDFISDTNFASVAEFTKHLLRDTIAGGNLDSPNHLSQEEVKTIRKRLEKLGYL